MGATFLKLALATCLLFFHGAKAQHVDACGEISGTLRLPELKPPHGVVNYGNIHECICFSHIQSYVATNPLAISAAAGAGKTAVTAAINEMFNSVKRHTCHYPPHSVPACVFGNPCGFECVDGFTPFPPGRPSQCICSKPYMVCNGKCGLFKACPSGHPVHFKRATEDKCPQGYTSCPIPGRGRQSEECVNTQSDLESCGGCVHAYGSDQNNSGLDCTVIKGVADVSCLGGQCVVHRCMPGYIPNSLHNLCTDMHESEFEIILDTLPNFGPFY